MLNKCSRVLGMNGCCKILVQFVGFTILPIPEVIPKGLNVNNHPEFSGWAEIRDHPYPERVQLQYIS